MSGPVRKLLWNESFPNVSDNSWEAIDVVAYGTTSSSKLLVLCHLLCQRSNSVRSHAGTFVLKWQLKDHGLNRGPSPFQVLVLNICPLTSIDHIVLNSLHRHSI